MHLNFEIKHLKLKVDDYFNQLRMFQEPFKPTFKGNNTSN